MALSDNRAALIGDRLVRVPRSPLTSRPSDLPSKQIFPLQAYPPAPCHCPEMASLFTWLRRLYSLDTLDTRFTATAITPANPNSSSSSNSDTRPAAKDARANSIAQNARASLWRTPEFFIYYLFFIILVPLMFKTVIDASKGEPSPLQRAGALATSLTVDPQNYRKQPSLRCILRPIITRMDSRSFSRQFFHYLANAFLTTPNAR